MQQQTSDDGVEIVASMRSIALNLITALGLIAMGIIGIPAGLAELSGYWRIIPFVWPGIIFIAGGVFILYELCSGRMRLVVDRNGIWARRGDREIWRLPWRELSTVEFRRASKRRALNLVATPIPGSPLLADKKAKGLWNKRDRNFVIDISMDGFRKRTVSAALIRYSGGRYRG
jgi:hypothetical protein